MQGVFQTGVLIEAILKAGAVPAGLDLYFYGSTPSGDQPLIYFHPSRSRKSAIAPLPRADVEASPHCSERITVGDRQWTVVASPIPGGPGTPNHFGSWPVLLAALFVTALVTAYIWSLGRYAQRIQAANKRLDEQNTRFGTAVANMSQGLLCSIPQAG